MGLQLKNPVIVAAGPWARDGASLQRCIDAGAGAVITETVTMEANANIYPRLYYDKNRLFNTKLYSNLHLEEWEEEIRSVDRKDAKLIVSIWGSSASELAYLAAKVERMGADAIEISISAPIGTRNQSINNHPVQIYEYIKAAVDAVRIPVMVKLSYEAAISPDILTSIAETGARAVSAIDALKGISGVDIEEQRAQMPAYGGYTGTNIRPAALATTASLKQQTSFEICSVGGISTYHHVLEFLMLGAQAVQIASVIHLHGYEVISTIISDLTAWLLSHGHRDVSAISGVALSTLQPFEDIKPIPMHARLTRDCGEPCEICHQSCIYGAVDRDERGLIRISPDRCTGCGLCIDRCPLNLIRLVWD